MEIFTKENKYRKQIIIFILLILFVILGIAVYGIMDSFNGCGTETRCFKRLITSPSYQHVFLPSLIIFFSLLPFLFLNPKIYRTWRWYAVVALPLMAWMIAATGEYDFFNRSSITMTVSVLFVIITLLIIIYKSIRLKFSKKQKDSK